jgi:catechol-2,3-dioxygenase
MMKILELQLETHCLGELKKFYTGILELPLLEERKKFFSFQAGATKVKFYRANPSEKPFYHFAFNIPENQLKDAKQWLSERTSIIEKDGRDEFRFEGWNAEALYFYDPASNIVELIARHSLSNRSGNKFSAQSILSVSEIGYVVEDVRLFSEHIKEELKLDLWDGDEQQFAAVGDEEGLLIVVPVDRNWFPVDKPAEIHPVTVNVGNE